MPLPVKITFAKGKDQAKSKLGYMLGGRWESERDETRRVEWEGWNLGDIRDVSDISRVWCDHIDRREMSRIINPRRGRPNVKTVIFISINEDAHTDYFAFIHRALWRWISEDFNDYMGLVAYHFKDVGFHAHMAINPIPLINLDVAHSLRISRQDGKRLIKNRYIEHRNRSIYEGIVAASRELGYSMGNRIEIPFDPEEFRAYSEIIRKSQRDLMDNLSKKDVRARVMSSPDLVVAT